MLSQVLIYLSVSWKGPRERIGNDHDGLAGLRLGSYGRTVVSKKDIQVYQSSRRAEAPVARCPRSGLAQGFPSLVAGNRGDFSPFSPPAAIKQTITNTSSKGLNQGRGNFHPMEVDGVTPMLYMTYVVSWIVINIQD